MLVEILPVLGCLKILRRDQFHALCVVPWVDKQLDAVFKQTPKGFQDSAREVRRPLRFKEFVEQTDAEDDGNRLGGVAAQIGRNPMELCAAANQDRLTECLERICAINEILVVDCAITE